MEDDVELTNLSARLECLSCAKTSDKAGFSSFLNLEFQNYLDMMRRAIMAESRVHALEVENRNLNVLIRKLAVQLSARGGTPYHLYTFLDTDNQDPEQLELGVQQID